MKGVNLIILGTVFILLFGLWHPAYSGFMDEFKKGLDDAKESFSETFGDNKSSEENDMKTKESELGEKTKPTPPQDREDPLILQVKESSHAYQSCMSHWEKEGKCYCKNYTMELYSAYMNVLEKDPSNKEIRRKLEELIEETAKRSDALYIKSTKDIQKNREKSTKEALECFSLLVKMSPDNKQFVDRKEELDRRITSINEERLRQEKEKEKRRIAREEEIKKNTLVVKGVYLGMPFLKAKKTIEKKYPNGSSGDLNDWGSDGYTWGIWLKGRSVQSIQIYADKNMNVTQIGLLHFDILFNAVDISMDDFVKMFSEAYNIKTPWKKLKGPSISEQIRNEDFSQQYTMETSDSKKGYTVRIVSDENGKEPLAVGIVKYENPKKPKPKFD